MTVSPDPHNKGGTDSLMFGNEQGLGTPFEGFLMVLTADMTSMAAVRGSKASKKFLLNIGIGVGSPAKG